MKHKKSSKKATKVIAARCSNGLVAIIILAVSAASLYFSQMGLWNFGGEGTWQASLYDAIYGGLLGNSIAGLIAPAVVAAILAYALATAARASKKQRLTAAIVVPLLYAALTALWIFSAVIFV